MFYWDLPSFYRVFLWQVSEATPVGTLVTRVRASDADEGPNAQLQFRLSGDGAELLTVDALTGHVHLLHFYFIFLFFSPNNGFPSAPVLGRFLIGRLWTADQSDRRLIFPSFNHVPKCNTPFLGHTELRLRMGRMGKPLLTTAGVLGGYHALFVPSFYRVFLSGRIAGADGAAAGPRDEAAAAADRPRPGPRQAALGVHL